MIGSFADINIFQFKNRITYSKIEPKLRTGIE